MPPTTTTTTTSSIIIRDAVPSDFSNITDVVVAAAADIAFFQFICPYSEQFPLSYRDRHLRIIKEKYYTSARRFLVAELVEESSGLKRIVGVACWGDPKTKPGMVNDLNGSMPRKISWIDQWKNSVESTLLSIEAQYIHLFHLDYSYSRPAWAIASQSKNRNPFSQHPAHLYLSLLVVDPAYQRRGVGTALVNWGIDLAKREGVPVGLKASVPGQRLYRSMGFEDVEIIEMAPGVHSTAMFWQQQESQLRQGEETVDQKE